MNKKNIEDIFPLSPTQQGILFHSILNPDSDIYTPQICLTFEGNIEPNRIKQTWQEIINRHQVLRAAFRWEKKDKTFQVIYKQIELPWVTEDWHEYLESEQENKLQEFLIADKKQGFNLKQSPLIRIALIQLSATVYKLVWTQHHIILDGWSSSLILKEFFTIYNGLQCQNPIPYGQYIAWLRQQDLEIAKDYWQTKLKGFVEPTCLKIYGQNLELESATKTESIELSIELSSKLKSFSKEHNLTLNTILQGAFAVLLARYTDSRDIVYGSTTSGRSQNLTNLESAVGLFINTLPMRVKLSDTESLLSWLGKLQQQQIDNLQYEYTPLAIIKDVSDIDRETALFENIFVFENYPLDTKAIPSDRDFQVSGIDVKEANNYPLTCLVKTGSEISIEIQYKSDYALKDTATHKVSRRHRFDNITITKILNSYQYLLAQILESPQQKLGQLSILLPEEEELIQSWQQTKVDYPLDKTIPELFLNQVNKTPDAIALIFEDKKYTYQELNEQADLLANHLIEIGVKPEIPVGIYLERSEKMAIAILAIIKAGGSYVPLDPIYPQNRIDFIIQDTGLNIILIQTKYQAKFIDNNLTIINLDFPSPPVSQSPSLPVSQSLHPNNPAYIIYTSGSTGKPKGVVNTHRSLVNRLLWMQDTYQLNSEDKVLQKTPFSFDVSVWEFFWTWLNGACLVIAKPEGHKDSNYLVELIDKEQITTLHFVPSMLEVFLEESNISSCKSIKKVICSGEALPINTKNKFFNKLNAELHNLYGPTEAAIDVTAHKCKQDKNNLVPIGKAIANTQIYILNSQQQINPIGIPGELHIGGVGLSRGYLNRPDLTAEKFIPNPFNEGRRRKGDSVSRMQADGRSFSSTPPDSLLYKTGDLACYLPDGNIQYLDRIDNNIKVRGFRIELGEIEAALEEYGAITKAVVIVRNDLGVNERIVAYVKGDRNLVQGISENLIASKLRHYLELKLPYYMIPDDFIFLEA
ncbi:MAG: amino acid adenylation domain-containing protein, partial [Cyanobacteria bacterium P01_G01_bin.67]